MKRAHQITYYCFNPDCGISVYHKSAANVRLPFDLETVSTDKYCRECKQQLISLMDIEIKKALLPDHCPDHGK